MISWWHHCIEVMIIWLGGCWKCGLLTLFINKADIFDDPEMLEMVASYNILLTISYVDDKGQPDDMHLYYVIGIHIKVRRRRLT